MIKLPAIRITQRQSSPVETRYSSLQRVQGSGQSRLKTVEKKRETRVRFNTQTSQSYKAKKVQKSIQNAKSFFMKNPTSLCQTNMKAYDTELLKQRKKQSATNQHKQLDLNKQNISIDYIFKIPKKLACSQISKVNRLTKREVFICDFNKTDRTEDLETVCTSQWLNGSELSSSGGKEIGNRTDRRKYQELSLSQFLEKDCADWRLHKKEAKLRVSANKHHQLCRQYGGW